MSFIVGQTKPLCGGLGHSSSGRGALQGFASKRRFRLRALSVKPVPDVVKDIRDAVTVRGSGPSKSASYALIVGAGFATRASRSHEK